MFIKIKKPPAKKSPEAQVSELPSRGHPDEVDAAIDPEAVDVQAARKEEADVDPVAERVDIRTPDVNVLEEPFAGGQEVADDRVDHHASFGRFLLVGEQRLLLVPGLAGRIRDGGLTDQMPCRLAVILRERLLVVPGILVAVEELALYFAADLDDRHREDDNEDVGVLALAEFSFCERDLSKCRELRSRWLHAEVPDRFLDAEEVLAHDFMGKFLYGIYHYTPPVFFWIYRKSVRRSFAHFKELLYTPITPNCHKKSRRLRVIEL